MFVKDKSKNLHYEALGNLYENPIKLIQRISKLIHICIRKSEIGLGFTLASEEAADKNESYTYVRKILDFSPAKYDGRLQVGDRILKINNLDVGSMSQANIVRLIRGLPIGDIITITVSRIFLTDATLDNVITISQSANYQVQSKLRHNRCSKLEIFHFIITITGDSGKISHCHASAGVLGISVECRTTERNSAVAVTQESTLCNQAKMKHFRQSQKQFFVKTILKNGSAYQDARLKIGDEILAVQGIDVQNGRTYILDPHYDIYGDIFHFDLSAVFLRNLEKLNAHMEFSEMFEVNSENPLHALKSLIKRAGDMYSSISIVVRRSVPLLQDRSWTDSDLIQKTYKSSKRKMNELCRIENIFELNPDYRHNYSRNGLNDERCKEEDGEDSEYRSDRTRLLEQRDSEACSDESGPGRSLGEFYEYECDKTLLKSNQMDQSELFSYFSKDYDNFDHGNDHNINDRGDTGDDSAGDFLDDVDKDIVNLTSNHED